MLTPRVIIWAAVSSKPQAAEDKDSLQVQENAGRAYADRIDGEIIDVLRVPGHSRDLWRWEDAEAKMPAYRSLRRHCEASDFDILFAWDTDRLGRDAALSQQVLSLVKRAGASVYIASGGYMVGGESESASYIYAIDGVRANQEQKRRVKRHKFGMQARVRRGLPPTRVPYGYRAVRDASGEMIGAEFVPDEAEAVRFVTRQYLDGFGYQSIAEMLDERGYSPPEADQWNAKAIHDFIHRDFYAGYVEWANTRNEEPSDKFPHIWDAETHRAIVNERHRRREEAGGSDIATFLSGTIYCNRCGAPMVHSPTTNNGRVYRYYRCSTRHRDRSKCHSNNVPLDRLLDAFDNWLATMREIGPELALRDVMPREIERLEQKGASLKAARAETEKALDRLAGAVASGTIRASTATRQEERLYEKLDSLDAEMQRVEEQRAALPSPEEQREYLDEVLDFDSANLNDATRHRLNRALRNLGVRFLCEDREVVAVVY